MTHFYEIPAGTRAFVYRKALSTPWFEIVTKKAVTYTTEDIASFTPRASDLPLDNIKDVYYVFDLPVDTVYGSTPVTRLAVAHRHIKKFQ